jgi:putative endonuclease
LGRWGENLAAEYLGKQGYAILEKNARNAYGEIDIIACQESTQGSLIVFVEVKTRTSTAYGLPEDSINPRKQAHLLAAAQAYLLDHPDLDADWRIDVIAIQRFPRGQPPLITHFENAIR